MMIGKELLSNQDSNTVDTGLDQETTTNVTINDDNSSVFNTGNLNISSTEDGVNNNDLKIPVVYSSANVSFESSGGDSIDHTIITNLDQVKNSNNVNISESSVVKAIKADNSANGNLNHQRCGSQNESAGNDVTSLPKKMLKIKRSTISASSIIKHKVLCCKLFSIFAMCCIIGIFSIPIIVYYVNQIRDTTEVDSDSEYSREINISNAEVCYEPSSGCIYFTLLMFI